jgi:hypothetical protein
MDKQSKGVVIGSAFAGRQGFAETRTGTYWEAMPPITGDCLRLQRGLIKHARKARLDAQRWPRAAPAMPPAPVPTVPRAEADPEPDPMSLEQAVRVLERYREDPPANGVNARYDGEPLRVRQIAVVADLNAERVAAGLPRIIQV